MKFNETYETYMKYDEIMKLYEIYEPLTLRPLREKLFRGHWTRANNLLHTMLARFFPAVLSGHAQASGSPTTGKHAHASAARLYTLLF